MSTDLQTIHQAAIEIARKGGEHTLNYFRKEINVDRKRDQSPVTAADWETEQLMHREIKSRFPDHGIIGEELGPYQPDRPLQWVLDPIDGTNSFIHGVPFYTTLIGILYESEPVAGVIYAPALDELCEAGRGGGARLNGEECSVRACNNLGEATFLTTDVTSAAEVNLDGGMRRLINKARLHRTWGDAYGHLMVATGRADLMFDPVLNIWDAAALLPIMREAGGLFCDVNGNETIDAGNGLSCSLELLDEVLAEFQ